MTGNEKDAQSQKIKYFRLGLTVWRITSPPPLLPVEDNPKKMEPEEMKNIIHAVPNVYTNQYYVQDFDFKCNNYRNAVDIFERMDKCKIIYEGVVK